ncbi:MAG: hypothetical protein GEV03_11335 [Streptosporangiales bacterium]|nr:hypothetical protein [Streptosporangiales bacterium]
MTGPEHYREAERLLRYVFDEVVDQYGDGAAGARQDLTATQVHATLAVADAVARAGRRRPRPRRRRCQRSPGVAGAMPTPAHPHA